jgi:hypothetical protein
MLAEIFMLQVEAQVRASPFSDGTVLDPRFVPVSVAPPTAPADDTGDDQSRGSLDAQDLA